MKATYCTLSNMKDKIGVHNAKILSGNNKNNSATCKCRNKANCLIPGECNQTNVVYLAKVHRDSKAMKYFGSTENFKNRYAVHKSSLNNRPACHTTLSSYVWKLKDQNIPYSIDWSIRARGHAFSSGSKSCDLCLTEKLIILTENQETMLNIRDKLLESCRHRPKHLLVSVKKQEIDTG